MKTHRFASHTAEESRRLSNLGHSIEGVLLGAVAVLALVGNVGFADWPTRAWPVLLLFAGIILLLLIYSRHPLVDWPAIWRDAQQRQHTLMAMAIVIAGAAELLQKSGSAWGYVWPVAVILVGTMFLIHKQHGTSEAAARALWLHRVLGITLITGGLLAGGAALTANKTLAILWPLVLLAAAVQLIIYREPEGAYAMGHEGHD